MNKPEWQWNEIQQIGTDYSSLDEVEIYDRRMAEFRDVEAENRDMLQKLNLAAGASVLEIGCGTGRFARAAAAAGHRVSAVDVSEIMLDYLNKKTAEAGSWSVETQHAGFLTMDFADESFDAVVSGAALHHLPDAWKLVALGNIFRVLKPGGRFILRDVVFVMQDEDTPNQCFERFVGSFSETIRPGAVRHVKCEYSTYDWIMEGLLTRAGFEIEAQSESSPSFVVYVCVKKA